MNYQFFFLSVFLLLIISIKGYSQESNYLEPDLVLVSGIEQMILDFNYPKQAIDLQLDGDVIVEFLVTELGEAGRVIFKKEAGYGFDEEAMRIISSSSYKPRIRNGVGYPYVLRAFVNFRIRETNKIMFEDTGIEFPASSTIDTVKEKSDFFVVVETMPILQGGFEELQKNVEYPEDARRAGIEGRVIVQFIVDENGQVENPRVIRGIGGGCDEAALEAVAQAKFAPGMQRGQPVRVQYSLPIVFRLADE